MMFMFSVVKMSEKYSLTSDSNHSVDAGESINDLLQKMSYY